MTGAAEIIQSSDPLAEEAGVAVHRTLESQPSDGCRRRMARLLARGALLMLATYDSPEVAGAFAARLSREFTEKGYRLQPGARRRK